MSRLNLKKSGTTNWIVLIKNNMLIKGNYSSTILYKILMFYIQYSSKTLMINFLLKNNKIKKLDEIFYFI